MAADLMAAWYIKTRAEFFAVLARTLECARRRSAGSPFWAHASVTAQLQAMTDWTAAGRTPTAAEQDRITIGHIAVREFDSEPEGEEAEFIECLVQLAGYFEEWPDDPHAAPENAPSLSPGLTLLLQRRIGLLSSAMHLPAGAATQSSLRAALGANADHVRLPGLPDELNPLVLDHARVEAFVEGLVRQPDKVLKQLESRWLALGVEGLYLSAASPVEADAIAGGYDLLVPDEEGSVVQASMRVPLRPAYAQSVVARAKAALAEFEAEVRTLEASGAIPSALMLAKWRRFAAASVWRSAARSLAEQSAKFKGDFKNAADSVRRYVMPPWASLPPR